MARDERSPAASSLDIAGLVADIRAAYGDTAKSFVTARLASCMEKQDVETEKFWMAVAKILWEADPDDDSEALYDVAMTIRLH